MQHISNFYFNVEMNNRESLATLKWTTERTLFQHWNEDPQYVAKLPGLVMVVDGCICLLSSTSKGRNKKSTCITKSTASKGRYQQRKQDIWISQSSQAWWGIGVYSHHLYVHVYVPIYRHCLRLRSNHNLMEDSPSQKRQQMYLYTDTWTQTRERDLLSTPCVRLPGLAKNTK